MEKCSTNITFQKNYFPEDTAVKVATEKNDVDF